MAANLLFLHYQAKHTREVSRGKRKRPSATVETVVRAIIGGFARDWLLSYRYVLGRKPLCVLGSHGFIFYGCCGPLAPSSVEGSHICHQLSCYWLGLYVYAGCLSDAGFR